MKNKRKIEIEMSEECGKETYTLTHSLTYVIFHSGSFRTLNLSHLIDARGNVYLKYEIRIFCSHFIFLRAKFVDIDWPHNLIVLWRIPYIFRDERNCKDTKKHTHTLTEINWNLIWIVEEIFFYSFFFSLLSLHWDECVNAISIN